MRLRFIIFRMLAFLLLLPLISALELPLHPNKPTCTIIYSSFDPIKVEARFPTIGSKAETDRFRISLINTQTGIIQQEQFVNDNSVFRNNFAIENNVLFRLCFEFVTDRQLGDDAIVFVGYHAEENFDNLIQKVEIPRELAKEDNIKIMYEVGSKMLQLNHITATHQQKERELEDGLVNLSLHKTGRIVRITLVECTVIIISGIYQVFALRKFLIEKNLY